MSILPQRILMCYGKTPCTPGSYLERAFGKLGIGVDVIIDAFDFSALDTQKYAAVLFVESPSRHRCDSSRSGWIPICFIRTSLMRCAVSTFLL